MSYYTNDYEKRIAHPEQYQDSITLQKMREELSLNPTARQKMREYLFWNPTERQNMSEYLKGSGLLGESEKQKTR